jgi:glycosyltransferase involved in cell wall biosynthesis
MRLALIVNGFPTISETFIVNKALGLQKAGLDVTVWVNSQNNDAAAFADRLRADPPVQVKPTLLARGFVWLPVSLVLIILKQPGKAARLWRQARRLYSQQRRAVRAWVLALPLALAEFDLIHFELSGLAVTYLDALPLLRPSKLLTSCRGAAEQIMPLMHTERVQQLREVFTQLDAIHCVSTDIQSTAQEYGLSPQKAFVNHPSIDTQQFLRHQPYGFITQRPYRIISVGRLHWKKGFEYGLLAIHHLVRAGFDVQYQIIGGGEEEEKLRYMINVLGLADRVNLSGYRSAQEVRLVLEQADIFLLPSLSEGLSNAVLEAMAMEIPVVSTTAGGMAEAITDGQEGFLVPPMQPELMAGEIRRLLENTTMRTEMGRAGRKRVESQFNLPRQISCFVEQYMTLIKAKAFIKNE